MAQLAVWSLPKLEVRNSKMVIGKILHWTYLLATIEKTKIKTKRPGIAHLKNRQELPVVIPVEVCFPWTWRLGTGTRWLCVTGGRRRSWSTRWWGRHRRAMWRKWRARRSTEEFPEKIHSWTSNWYRDINKVTKDLDSLGREHLRRLMFSIWEKII